MARMDLTDIDVEVVAEDWCTFRLDVSRLVAKVDRLNAAALELAQAWEDFPLAVRESMGDRVITLKVRRDET